MKTQNRTFSEDNDVTLFIPCGAVVNTDVSLRGRDLLLRRVLC